MNYIIGIDEAGRGPWAGPVVVGGFLVQAEKSAQIFRGLPKLDDSKKLSHLDRENIFHDIERLQFEQECQHAFSYRDAHMIDILGIREANRQCMQDVIASLLQFVSESDTVEIFVDGCDNYVFDSFDGEYVFAKKKRKIKDTERDRSNFCHPVGAPCETKGSLEVLLGWIPFSGVYEKEIISFSKGDFERDSSARLGMTKEGKIISYVIHGDSLVPAISAASIVAKVVRDRIMCEFHKDFPQYGFDEHKGYGTVKHKKNLINYGISPIHRKTYAPVKALISQATSV